MCNERNKAIVQVVIALRNRMSLMSQKTKQEIEQLITQYSISAQDLVDMAVEMAYRV